MSAEWVKIAPGVFWCKGCGCIKFQPHYSIKVKYSTTKWRYLVPQREKDRRETKKAIEKGSK